MLNRFLYVLTVCSLLCMAVDTAAQGMDEIIVTASRVSRFEDDNLPVVHLKRRPDFMVVSAYIESDSRSDKLRRKEIQATLAALEKRAGSATNIELGLSRVFETDNDEIEYVVPFSKQDALVTSGYRPDTSRIALIIKSPVLAGDKTPDVIYERIEEFMDSVEVSGRAVISDSGDANFSLVNIAQYRSSLIEKIAADVKTIQTAFGPNYRASVGGFDEPVRWRVTGPMELSIYFPYFTSIAAD